MQRRARTLIIARRSLDQLGFIAAPALLIAIVVLRLPLDSPIGDFFHEGEYFGSFSSVLHGARYGYPYLPHGLLDVLPFRIGEGLCGTVASFGCTRLVNVMLTAVAMTTYTWCAALVIGARRDLAGLAIIAVAGLFILINGQAPDLVSLHQGAPSVRDAMLFLELALLFQAGVSTRFRTLLYISAGIVAAFNVFWCYNRGVIGIAVVCIFVISAMLRRVTQKDALALSSGCAVGVALIYASDAGAFTSHLRNILFWANMVGTSDAHSVRQVSVAAEAFDVKKVFAADVIVTALIVSALAGLALSVRRYFKGRDGASWDVPTIALAIVALLFAKVTLTRPDIAHAIFSLPAVLLLLLRLCTLTRPGLLPAPTPAAVLSASAIIMLIVASSTSPHTLKVNFSSNARLMVSGMPTNQSLVSVDVWQAALLLKRAGGCTLSIDNEGVYYALSGLPACSPFMYPFYAPSTSQSVLIADLSRNPPVILVGRSLRHQIVAPLAVAKPEANAWIIEHYPEAISIGNILLRAQSSNGHLPLPRSVPSVVEYRAISPQP